MGYRSTEFEKIANGRNVVQIAIDVHMTNTGSWERPYVDQEADIKCLKEVIEQWSSSKWERGKIDGAFDDAVKMVITIALCECEMRELQQLPRY